MKSKKYIAKMVIKELFGNKYYFDDQERLYLKADPIDRFVCFEDSIYNFKVDLTSSVVILEPKFCFYETADGYGGEYSKIILGEKGFERLLE